MTESANTPDYDGVHRFCDLSAQFSEAYWAYAHRPSQVHRQEMEYESPADEVEVFLLYHALELALKGWLLFRMPGMTTNRLRAEYRHGIVELGRAVQPFYPGVEPYLSLMGELVRLEYAYPDIEDAGVHIPMPIEPFAEFVSQCRFDLAQDCEREKLSR